MDYQDVTTACQAQESDWLDVSYSERNYVLPQPTTANLPKKRRVGLKILAVALLAVAVFATMLLVDGNFQKDVFQTAKRAYSSVLAFFDGKQSNDVVQIAIPSNANLIDVVDGVATFGGGRATLSFTQGNVTEVTQDSVTVAIDDKNAVTYSNLTDVFVAVGDEVSKDSLLGKYNQTFTATFSSDGQAVKDVIASEQQLTWEV